MCEYRLLRAASNESLAHRSSEHAHKMKFTEVFEEEQRFIDRNKEKCGEADDDVRFSLALGGGGVRAASFEAGVIWRLAEKGLLKNVEYVSANSGGSFVAGALASHIYEAGLPPSKAHLDKWYLEIVAKMITRMLTNAPFMARECGRQPFAWPKDGSSCLPRFFDMFILLGVLAFTLVFRPLFMLELLLRPLFDAIDWVFSGAMMAAFCSRRPWGQSVQLFWQLSSFQFYLHVLGWMVLSAVMAWLVTHAHRKRKRRSTSTRHWLYARSTVATLVRLSLFLFLMLTVVLIALNLQILVFSYDNDMVQRKEYYCQEYFHHQSLKPKKHCRDEIQGTLWYTSGIWTDSWNKTQEENFARPPQRRPLRFELRYLTIFLLGAVLAAMLSVPFLPRLIIQLLSLIWPIFTFGVIILMVQFRIFRPFLPEFKQDLDDPKYTFRIYGTIMLVLPFSPWLSSSAHIFYRRSLQKCFIAGGKDTSWGELRSNHYIPFMLFNGTAVDYMRPWDDSPTSEMSFSPLHIGGERTWYYQMAESESVSKFMALSSAATDAFIIGMHDSNSYRFLLSLLGLGVGKPILMCKPENWLPRTAWLQGFLQRSPNFRRGFLHRLIEWKALLFSELLFVFLSLAHWTSYVPRECKCTLPSAFYAASGVVALLMLVGSFFGFLSQVRFMLHGPLVHLIHQLSRFYHCDLVPPRLLYITDGGVMDSTGIMQLLRRQRERILFVLNEDDPHDNMPALRKLVLAAQRTEIASLYDPRDPRRDVNEVLKSFQLSRQARYLHLGILYGYAGKKNGGRLRRTGHLFVIKNRLPVDLESHILPLLTEAEILGNRNSHAKNGMTESDLGGCTMCCDCCHRSWLFNCSCGTNRFPNAPIVNQFLTPTYLSSLCRLGHALSDDAINAVASKEELAEMWEEYVCPDLSLKVGTEEDLSPRRNISFMTATQSLLPPASLSIMEDNLLFLTPREQM